MPRVSWGIRELRSSTLPLDRHGDEMGTSIEYKSGPKLLVQVTIVGTPIALLMFNRTPFIASLYRY